MPACAGMTGWGAGEGEGPIRIAGKRGVSGGSRWPAVSRQALYAGTGIEAMIEAQDAICSCLAHERRWHSDQVRLGYGEEGRKTSNREAAFGVRHMEVFEQLTEGFEYLRQFREFRGTVAVRGWRCVVCRGEIAVHEDGQSEVDSHGESCRGVHFNILQAPGPPASR